MRRSGRWGLRLLGWRIGFEVQGSVGSALVLGFSGVEDKMRREAEGEGAEVVG